MSTIPPTNPYHIARAYGVQPAAQVSRGGAATQNVGASSQVSAATGVSGPAAKLPTVAQRLVAATVPGRVDFSGDKPRQVSGPSSAGTYAMYKDAGAKNAAATAVTVGRVLDVRG